MKTYVLTGIKPRPKARPLAGRGKMFMPEDYQTWKETVRNFLAGAYAPQAIHGACVIDIELHAPYKPRGDLDNLAGGILDAIQPPRARGDVRAQRALEKAVSIEDRLSGASGCLIADDKQVVSLSIRWVKSKTRAIVIRVEEIKAS